MTKTSQSCIQTFVNASLILFFGLLLFNKAVFAGQLTASVFHKPVEDQQDIISVNIEEELLTDALQLVALKADVGISYRTGLIPSKKVSYRAVNKPLYDILYDLLKGTDLYLKLSSNREVILIKRKAISKEKLQQKVVGTVTDSETGEPMVAVNVYIEETNVGTTTNEQGKYILIIPDNPNTVITFSFIGYFIQQIKVGNRDTINVALEPKVQQMEQMVVTGKIERNVESFTGSYVTITDEELERLGGGNVFQTLTNIVPSFVITRNFLAGSNPNVLPELKLRGTSTFPAQNNAELRTQLKGNYIKAPNQPLFVLDGFPASVETISDLDSDRIASVTILKDAAAKAMYGARAANGVVVIETKKVYTTEPVVTYQSNITLEVPDLSSYNLMTPLQKLKAEKIDGFYTADDSEDALMLEKLYYRRLKLVKEGLFTDWMAKPLRNGIGQSHSISVALGTENLKVLGNIDFGKETGVMEGSFRRNLGGLLKLSYRTNDLLLRTKVKVNKNQGENSPYGRFYTYTKMNPYWNAVNQDGNIPYYVVNTPSFQQTNPLFNTTLNTINTTDYLRFVNNYYLKWFITNNLDFQAKLGIGLKNNRGDEFYPAPHTRFEDIGIAGESAEETAERKGLYAVNDGNANSILAEARLRYTNRTPLHYYSGSLGFNISQDKFEETVYEARGFPSSRMQSIIFGRSYPIDSSPIGIQSIQRQIGLIATGAYMYDERYMVNATLRPAANSKFGRENRWGTFWSLGAGWNLHNEDLMQNIDFVDRLKLTASVGKTGNPNFLTNVAAGSYNYYLDAFYNGLIGSYVTNMANPALKWEAKMDYNIGLNADIGNLRLSADYFESITTNLVTSLALPSSTGFSFVKENVGKVRNHGFELGIQYLLWQNTDGYFTITANVSRIKNVILDLSEAMENYNQQREMLASRRGESEPVLKYTDGNSLTTVWAVPSMGIDPATGREIYITPSGRTTYNWNADYLQPVGNTSPDLRGNFGFFGQYKGVGLSVRLRFQMGAQLYNRTLLNRVENINIRYNLDARVLTGRWKQPGDYSLFKRLGTFCRDNPNGSCTPVEQKTRRTARFVQDLNELTIGAVSLFYEFQPEVLNTLGLSRLRLSLNMNEVATFSTIQIERGLYYPFARNFAFELTARF